jgi:putative membrane protein
MMCVAQSSGTPTKSSAMSGVQGMDLKFAKGAAQGGMAEVELGKLAVDKAQNPDVKQFGQKMVDDHSKANDELKSIAEKDNITLPQQLTAKDQATKNRLSKLNGAAFDKAYMHDMVMDHVKDVNEFKQEAKFGKNEDIKGFAAKYTPTLEEHLKMAKETNSKVGGGAVNSKMKKPAASPSGQ